MIENKNTIWPHCTEQYFNHKTSKKIINYMNAWRESKRHSPTNQTKKCDPLFQIVLCINEKIKEQRAHHLLNTQPIIIFEQNISYNSSKVINLSQQVNKTSKMYRYTTVSMKRCVDIACANPSDSNTHREVHLKNGVFFCSSCFWKYFASCN